MAPFPRRGHMGFLAPVPAGAAQDVREALGDATAWGPLIANFSAVANMLQGHLRSGTPTPRRT